MQAYLLLLLLLPLVTFLIPLATRWYALLREPIWPVVLRPCTTLPALAGGALAAQQEVEAMGFEVVAAFEQEERPGSRLHYLLYRHRDGTSYALQAMSAAITLTPYPLAFYSFTADQRILLTINRQAWLGFAAPPEVISFDPYANSAATHWQAHQKRLTNTDLLSLPVDAAQQRIVAAAEGAYPASAAKGGLCRQGPYYVWPALSALRTAYAWHKAAKRINSPYQCAGSTEKYIPGIFAARYAYLERYRFLRAERPAIKFWLTALSGLLFFGLWAAFFSWQEAVILVVVLLVHELGHAAAMRLFGHKDMSIFFLPFLGAVVSAPERAMATWQRAIVLLAGPVPGMILAAGLGLALLLSPGLGQLIGGAWLAPAFKIAFAVNLFNLLPFTPLDGGRLLEAALFAGHPRLRFAFAGASALGFVGLAIWLQGPISWGIAVVMVFALLTQWRALRIHLALSKQAAAPGRLALFRLALTHIKAPKYAQCAALVRLVESQRLHPKARLWESLPITLFLACVWLGVGSAVVLTQGGTGLFGGPSAAGAPASTSAQDAFDQHYVMLDDLEADDATMAKVRHLAQALATNDPRQLDLAWLEASRQHGSARAAAQLAIIRTGQAGHFRTRREFIGEYLTGLDIEYAHLPPQDHATSLQAALDDLRQSSGAQPADLIDTRLRIARAWDRAGDLTKAERTLAESAQDAARVAGKAAGQSCPAPLSTVLSAQAWYYLSHQRPSEALALLRQPACQGELRRPGAEMGETLAWALLQSDDKVAGLAQMQVAAYTEPYRPPLLLRLLGSKPQPAHLIRPLPLAYALHLTGQDPAAQALLQGKPGIAACARARVAIEEEDADIETTPWTSERLHRYHDAATTLCPHQTNPPAAQAPSEGQ